MKKKILSIIDIADHLNLSRSTVSFILNGKGKENRISERTEKKVLEFVNKVGYKPNLLARSLRTGKSNIIGLMVEDISDPFFARVAGLIEENAYKNGYKILYCSTENEPEKARELIQMFYERRIDGYIITPSEGIQDDIDELVNTGAAVVLFDRYFENSTLDYVVLDNFQRTYNAVEHLVSRGYDEIGFVTINSLQLQMQERLHGYEKAMKDNHLRCYEKKIGFHTDDKSVVGHIVDFLKKKRNLNAVIFSTNYLGINGLIAISQMGLSIPDDIAVISFDDNILFQLYAPAITAIAQPVEAMSEMLINILLSKLASKSNALHQVTLQGKLIVRESTAKRRIGGAV